MKLTKAQFESVEDTHEAAMAATKLGTPERAAVMARFAVWEAAIALPQGTKVQRDARNAAIVAAAGLVQS